MTAHRQRPGLLGLPEAAMLLAKRHPADEVAARYSGYLDDLLHKVTAGTLTPIDARMHGSGTPWRKPLAEAGLLYSRVLIDADEIDALEKAQGSTLAPLQLGVAPSTPPPTTTTVPVPAWQLKAPVRDDGLAASIYRVLKLAQDAGRRRPNAREVLDLFREDKPPEVEVVNADDVVFYDARGVKACDLEGLRKRIGKMTRKRSLSVP